MAEARRSPEINLRQQLKRSKTMAEARRSPEINLRQQLKRSKTMAEARRSPEINLRQQLKRSKTMAEAEYIYLPDDCWRHIFKYLKDDDDDDYDHNRDLKSLSVVSKQFFSITNCLRLSLTIHDPTALFLSRLFHRFTNLTSLDLTHFHGNLDTLLRQISLFPLKLTSLILSPKPNISVTGLRVFSLNITTLTSLICTNLPSFTTNHLFLIAECFPLLEELDLDLSDPNDLVLSVPNARIKYRYCNITSFLKGFVALTLSLSKLRKINLSSHFYIDDRAIFHLFNNCKLLEEVILLDCDLITKAGVASALSEKQTTLRSLSLPKYITTRVIDSLVSLKGLTYINLYLERISDELLTSVAMAGLPLRRIAIRDCTGYSYAGLFTLLSKCQSIQHLKLAKVPFLNDDHVMELSSYLVGLVSISLNSCLKVTDSSLFALVRKCPSLSEIKMKRINFNSEGNYDNLMDFGVYPQLKSLSLPFNQLLNDERITIFVSGFPNLHMLDLNYCANISQKGIVQVLKRCPKISHLSLTGCNLRSSEDVLSKDYERLLKICSLHLSLRDLSSGVNLLGMNFEVPKLKMLNLSFSEVDDETLYSISKSCCGLLQLVINDCLECTEKGVKHVVENCTQLREINLKNCQRVLTSNVAPSMLFSSPSLRKITALPHIYFSEIERRLFLHRGCIVC